MDRNTTEQVGQWWGQERRDISGQETAWYLIADFTEEKCGGGG